MKISHSILPKENLEVLLLHKEQKGKSVIRHLMFSVTLLFPARYEGEMYLYGLIIEII